LEKAPPEFPRLGKVEREISCGAPRAIRCLEKSAVSFSNPWKPGQKRKQQANGSTPFLLSGLPNCFLNLEIRKAGKEGQGITAPGRRPGLQEI
jgi:hypothetical protein